MDTPLWGVRVQAPFGARVQKVQRIQRVEVGASNYGRRPLIIKPLQPFCGRGNAFPLWCRKAPKGGKSHRRWLITVVLIISMILKVNPVTLTL